MTPLDVTWRQVLRWRMRRQLPGGAAPPPAEPVAVARRLGGVHAQVASCATAIAGVRGVAAGGLDDALWQHRALVRTWTVRGTLHLVPADDLDLWCGALSARESRRRFPPSWEREHGVDEAGLHAITTAVGEVLGPDPVTRAELAERICAHLRDPGLAGPLATSWGALLKPAAARGLLCSGPSSGPRSTFVSPAGWLGRAVEPVDEEAAERHLLLAFLAVNGPATVADIARWWGEQPAPARRRVRACADVLTDVRVDGTAGFVVATADADALAATPHATDAAAPALLLPGFDPWTIAPRSHRRRAVPDAHEKRVSRTAGWISPVVVADGEVVGTWAHERSGGTLRIVVTPWARPGRTLRGDVDEHAHRHAELLAATDVVVEWASPLG